MRKPFDPRELPSYLTVRQADLSDTEFAAALDISRQYLRLMRNGTQFPYPRILSSLGLEMVVRVGERGRYIPLGELCEWLTKKQGKRSDAEQASRYGLTRQRYYLVKNGITAVPAPEVLSKMGLVLMYRELKGVGRGDQAKKR